MPFIVRPFPLVVGTYGVKLRFSQRGWVQQIASNMLQFQYLQFHRGGTTRVQVVVRKYNPSYVSPRITFNIYGCTPKTIRNVECGCCRSIRALSTYQ